MVTGDLTSKPHRGGVVAPTPYHPYQRICHPVTSEHPRIKVVERILIFRYHWNDKSATGNYRIPSKYSHTRHKNGTVSFVLERHIEGAMQKGHMSTFLQNLFYKKKCFFIAKILNSKKVDLCPCCMVPSICCGI